MLRIALKSALYNKRRLIGTGLSIVIGIAFLAGTFVFTDTIKRTFDTLFANGYANTDAYVRSSSEQGLRRSRVSCSWSRRTSGGRRMRSDLPVHRVGGSCG
jgi:hypothetical protein